MIANSLKFDNKYSVVGRGSLGHEAAIEKGKTNGSIRTKAVVYG